jgi:hypothetical protein
MALTKATCCHHLPISKLPPLKQDDGSYRVKGNWLYLGRANAGYAGNIDAFGAKVPDGPWWHVRYLFICRTEVSMNGDASVS